MFKNKISIGNKELKIETGKMAKQANGSVLVSLGETVVLVTATSAKQAKEDMGFFPLSVDYREKYYAAGKIPGGFLKREARPSDVEILAARLTDRPIRPLFPENYLNETIISINVLSYDDENNADILGTIGASAALAISDIPWDGPVASVRIAKDKDGKHIVNPTISELEDSNMEVIVSGTMDSIVMVEGEADYVSEEDFLTALQYAHEVIKDIVTMQNDMVKKFGIKKRDVLEPEVNLELNQKIDSLIDGKVGKLNDPKNKKDHYDDIDRFIKDSVDSLLEEFPDNESEIKSYINSKISEDLRSKVLKGKRADGRSIDKVRKIEIDTSILPRVHGSSLFTRGETQALVVTTLGGKQDEKMIDDITGKSFKNYMLHYNFPPFCVGEARPKFSLSRREVGHGNLAERSVKRSLPSHEDFPYTIRIVSEILESNGSSSMATVCGASLSLMDAGVPVKAPIAGVAMGLVMEDEKNYSILTDILGTEDHIGDMDFKVAGSEDGITAIQMDLKIKGLPIKIMQEALEQARLARLHILKEMGKAIDKPRTALSKYAPKIESVQIPVDRIGEFIGPGGKNIKSLAEKFECEFNVEDDGLVTILGQDAQMIESATKYVKGYSLVPKIGDTYDGEVVRIMDFGAFVQIAPGRDGLVHISELAWGHVKKVEDAVKIGDKVKVKLIKIDEMKRINLSIKALTKKPDHESSKNNEKSGNKNFSNNKKGFKKEKA